MKRLLTALASIALVGTLFAGVPAPVRATDDIGDAWYIYSYTANIDTDGTVDGGDGYADVDTWALATDEDTSCEDATNYSQTDYDGYDGNGDGDHGDAGEFPGSEAHLNDILTDLLAAEDHDGDTFVLCEGTYYVDGTVILDGTDTDITIIGDGNVTVIGDYVTSAFVDSDDSDGPDNFVDNWQATYHPNSYDNGFIDATDTDLTIENVTFEDLGNDGDESAVEVVNGSLHVEDVTFADNLADFGAAIYADSTTSTPIEVTLVDVNFDGNEADDAGGAIYLDDANLTATDSLFYQNEAYPDNVDTYGGGAIMSVTVDATTTEMSFVDTVFDDNYSDSEGGAIYAICSSIAVTSDEEDDRADISVGPDSITGDSYFIGNESYSSNGGAILSRKTAYNFGDPWGDNCSEESNPTLTIDGVEFMANEAGRDDTYHMMNGGAIATFGVDLSISNSEFGLFDDSYGNYAGDSGGAIYADGTTGFEYEGWSNDHVGTIDVTIENTNFYQNYADGEFDDSYQEEAGGAIATNCANLTVRGGWTPAHHEDGLNYQDQADYSSGTVFQWNESDEGDGGAISTGSTDCATTVATVITGAEFYDNHADERGGAIATNDDVGYHALWYGENGSGDSNLTITSSVFTENDSNDDEDGGAVQFGDESSNLSVTNSRFDENYANSDGGAIDTDDGEGTVTITGTRFYGNYAEDEGGAVNSEKATTVRTSVFVNNVSSDDGGGAIAMEYGPSLTVSGSTFIGNEATSANYGGGAIFIDSDNLRLSIGSSTFTENLSRANCYFCGNEADGGAIQVHGDDVTLNVNSSSFTGNEADGDGGAIDAWYQLYATVSGSTFTDNSSGFQAGDGGGAIRLNDGGSLSIVGSTFTGNHNNQSRGGAVYAYAASASISASTFTSNTTNPYGYETDNGRGGAVYACLDYGATLTVLNSAFNGNHAGRYGGAIDTNAGCEDVAGLTTIRGTTFTSNHAGVNGGALDLDGPALVDRSVFTRNIAPNYGGAIWAGVGEVVSTKVPQLTITASTFTSNGGGTGGGIYAEDSLMLQNNKFTGNSARFEGGAVYAVNLQAKASWFNGNLFDSNTATVGGGLWYEATSGNQKLVVNANRFTKNRATVGGGVYVDIDATPAALPTAFTRNQFDGNIAGVGGGAAFGYNGAAYRTARAAQQAFDKAMKGNTFAVTNRATGDKNTSKYGGILRTTVAGLFLN